MLMIVSCQEDEIVLEQDAHETHLETKQGFIDFDEFFEDIGSSSTFIANSKHLDKNRTIQFEGRGADLIGAYIDTSIIHLIETDSINYYTLKVINNNSEEKASIFYNFIFEQNLITGEVSSSVLQYNPELSWLFDKSKDFKGAINKFDNTVLTLDDLFSGVTLDNRTSSGSCLFSAIPTWIECGGDECPCDDYGGYAGPTIYSIVWCPQSGEGGGPGGGNNGDNNNDGNGTSGGSGGGGGGNFGGTTQTVVLELCNDFLPDGDTDSEDCVEDFSVFFTPYMCGTINSTEQAAIHTWAFANQNEATPLANYLANNYDENNSNNCVDIDFDEQIIIDNTFQSDPRLSYVFNKFKSGNNTIGQYISNFIPDGSVANLRFSADENFQSNQTSDNWDALAITIPPNNYLINIVFNKDNNLDNSTHNFPKIVLAVGLMHETVHAEMFRKLMSVAGNPNVNFNNLSDEDWGNFLINLMNEFPGVWDYFIRYEVNNSNPTSADHEQMEQHYITTMAGALSDYDDGNHSQAFYEALSWIGLKETTAWDLLTATEQQNIETIIQNAIDNEPFN